MGFTDFLVLCSAPLLCLFGQSLPAILSAIEKLFPCDFKIYTGAVEALKMELIWNRGLEETTIWNHYRQNTKKFKWDGNNWTLITSWLVMILISPICFPMDRIMTSSFRASMLQWSIADSPCTSIHCRGEKILKSKIRFQAPPHCTAPTFTAKPIYFQPGKRKAAHACELERVLNISITAHRLRKRER